LILDISGIMDMSSKALERIHTPKLSVVNDG